MDNFGFNLNYNISLISQIKSKLFGEGKVTLETPNDFIDDEIDFTNAPKEPGGLHNKSFQEKYVDIFISKIKYTWEKEGKELVNKDKIIFTKRDKKKIKVLLLNNIPTELRKEVRNL